MIEKAIGEVEQERKCATENTHKKIVIKIFQIMNQNIFKFHRKARRGEIYSEMNYLTGEISVR